MTINHANAPAVFTTSNADASFNSVWGNAMQREDFLALAASLRQFNVLAAEIAFSNTPAAEHVDSAAQ